MKKITLAAPLALALLCPLSAQAGAAVIEPVMVVVKAGEFMMGNPTPAAAGPHEPSDGPVHKVSVKTFKLSKYELTVKEFRQFVDATAYVPVGLGDAKDSCWKWVKPGDGAFPGAPVAITPGRWNSPAYAPSDYHPAMCISWNDGQAYVQWLSQQTGKKYRLPSEAEWEYAARAGSDAKFVTGEDTAGICRFANTWDKSGKVAFLRDLGWDRKDGACDDMGEYTTVVGMYEANAFGLHDMIGNVGEFVQDCEHATYEGAPSDGSAWTGKCDPADMRIARGSNYASGGAALRFSGRGHAGQSNHSSMGEGIRIAQQVDNEADLRAAPNGFAAELERAQQAERARRAQALAARQPK